MPNGGYPLSLLLTPAERPDLCLHSRGLTLALHEWTTRPGGDHILAHPPLADFTADQSEALLYHLAYWGLGKEALPLLNRGRKNLGILPRRPGVDYDY